MTTLKTSAGISRVYSPKEAISINPYDAWALDPNLPLGPDEVKVKVRSINLDSTSANQLWEKYAGNEIEFIIGVRRIIADRGKMHNPTTNSGGVLCGEVQEVGERRKADATVGMQVATLVSNTLVPLRVDKVLGFNRKTHQLDVEGIAILPPFAKFAKLPNDIRTSVALSVLDVCGVVPQIERLCGAGMIATILGASGKAGILSTYTASKAVGSSGRVIALVPDEAQQSFLRDMPSNVVSVVCDAKDAVELEEKIRFATDAQYSNVVVDCTNQPGVEIGAASCCRDGGTVYFFNMATRFQAAALGAELVSRDIQYVIGYGLLPRAEERAFALVRSEPGLLKKLNGGTK